MFSARKAKAAPPRQQSVAPQIERSTTGSSLDDSNESSRRGDVALCCAYVLQGSDWAPVNNSRPDDLSGESRFLAAKIVQDEDMAEAFLVEEGRRGSKSCLGLVGPRRVTCRNVPGQDAF